MSDQTELKLFVPGMAGIYDKVKDLPYPLVRFAGGAILAPHGAQKLFGWFGGNPAGAAKFFEKVGLSPGAEWLVFIGSVEFFGGIMLAIGLFTRVAAAAITIQMLVIVFWFQWQYGYFWTGRGFEFALLWAAVAFAMFCGGGRNWSVDRLIGKEF